MKDELSELLEDNSLDDEVMEEVVDESQCQEVVMVEASVPSELPKKKVSRATQWWKR